MSDTIFIAIIGIVGTFITTAGIVIVAWLQYKNNLRLAEVHHQVNGMQAVLVKTTKDLGHAQGKAEGKAEGKIEEEIKNK